MRVSLSLFLAATLRSSTTRAFVPSTPAFNTRRNVAAPVLDLVKAKISSEVGASEDVNTSQKDEVRSLFNLWNDALATGDSRIVASRYTSSPLLLPTVSDEPRTDYNSVKDYFDAFLKKEPQGEIIEGFVNIGEDGKWASDAGIYEFTMGNDGSKVKARYSFLYVKEDDIWKIQHHHSSVMPEEIAMGKSITEDEVKGLFSLWNDALATGDSKKVASRYAKEGVLLPTVSDTPRTDFNGINDYFLNFLQKKPQGEIISSNVMIGHNWCQDAGIYEFTFGATGQKVKGRYSFIYIWEDGEWKIAHHHSSVMPEGIVVGEPITTEEVQGLFNLWNGALATLDPNKVADRYSKNGVLLPTVSDVPRTDNDGIVDYFTNFLKLKPQGEIVSSNVIVGTNWAQDAGIYEFTMGTTGDKVKGRYTFVYVFEDGEWKISQHHSSVMPEASKTEAPPTEAEVKSLFELWNSALATGDSRIVAHRYSSDALLLPTVSDTPRTDFDSINDYFDGFLKKQPQGKILDSHVRIGKNGDWASDAGIYEFTMGATGDVVKARYSFVYVKEDDTWKIQHHHSSVMPEEIVMGKAITEDEARGLFKLWNDALATGNSKKVASRYAKKGVLLPTVSDTPRTDFDSINDYFTSFLKLKPQGEILESYVTIGNNWCQDAGIYEFTFGANGKKVKGRYSFIYTWEDDEWKIAHHHSSIMPEGIVTAEPITKKEVRSLFGLWNDALATLDPTEVANRYSNDAVLLPTVSDVPRTDYPGIVDYFTNFLKLKPQGEILSGDIIVGTNWAQDAGIYEFTMGATGAKVKGRYTYVYVFEDGEWKISQHHSSVMPEANKPKDINEAQVRNLFQLWNSALATEDADAVAKRYAKDATLLPTVSDVPRTDYDLIKDYFEGFLKKKPQGKILDSYVTIGDNWCQDTGIYEFTMGATGDKVAGRYSFIYTHEDNQWKIAHHHSSVMPEAFLGPAPKPQIA